MEYSLWEESEQISLEMKKELKNLKEDKKSLEDAFYKEIEFGTGGMRGKMGAGTNRINEFSIRSAALKLSKSLKINDIVIIAYDTRKSSKLYAYEAAKVLSYNNIKTYVFEEATTTPLLSYTVRKMKASAGIVITASHNPKEYNGFKLYNSEGCQMVPSEIEKIISQKLNIDSILNINGLTESELFSSSYFSYVSTDTLNNYIDDMIEVFLKNRISIEDVSVNVVYSPLHGTGYTPIKNFLKKIGAENIIYVENQIGNDGTFPTVTVPNPEDKDTFFESYKYCKDRDIDIVLLTDPDCDRVGVSIKHQDDFIRLNGNEIGALIINYLKDLGNQYTTNDKIVKTIVTSELGAKIGISMGCTVENTLTGFKYIGEKAEQYRLSNQNFVFGYEESYGYLLGDKVRDKDGVISTILIILMANYYKNKGETLYDSLEKISLEFGYFKENQLSYVYEGIDGSKKMSKIMEKIYNIEFLKENFSNIDCIENYSNGTSYKIIGDKMEISNILLPKSDVLKVIFKDHSWFVIRPSGTEPKLKVYISVNHKEKSVSNNRLEKLAEEIQNILE